MSISIAAFPMAATRAPVRSDVVDPQLIRTLQSKGMHSPLRSLCDPRIEYPDLLLLDNFDYEPAKDGSRYVRCVDGPQYSQTVELDLDKSRHLITRCGDRGQELVRHADGTFSQRQLKY